MALAQQAMVSSEQNIEIPYRNWLPFKICQRCRSRNSPCEYCKSERLFLCYQCVIEHIDVASLASHERIETSRCQNIDMQIASRREELDLICRLINRNEAYLEQKCGFLEIVVETNQINDVFGEHNRFLNELCVKGRNVIFLYKHVKFLARCVESLQKYGCDGAIIWVGPLLSNIVKQVDTILSSKMSPRQAGNTDATNRGITFGEGDYVPQENNQAQPIQRIPREELHQSSHGLEVAWRREAVDGSSINGSQNSPHDRASSASSVVYQPSDESHVQEYRMLPIERYNSILTTADVIPGEHRHDSHRQYADRPIENLSIQHPMDSTYDDELAGPVRDREDHSTSPINLH